MPLASAISRVPQRWIICMLCSLALLGSSFRDICFFNTYNIVRYFTAYSMFPLKNGDAYCPYAYSSCQWERRQLPFPLPNVFWNPSILDMSVSTYRMGKFVMAVPAGVLSDLGYSRYVLGGGMSLVTIAIMLLTTTDLGPVVFVMSSTVEGVGAGMILPSVITLICQWAPTSKRNTFTVLVVAGFYCGYIVGYIIFHLTYKKISSWHFGYYCSGTFGIFWLILWYIFGYHSPCFSPFGSQNNQFITSSKGPVEKMRRIPWKNVVFSPPFLSVVLLYCCLQWIVAENTNHIIEEYQRYILHLPTQFSKSSSIVSIVSLPTSLMGGFLADWVIEKRYMSRIAIKKFFVFKSIVLSSVFIVSATFMGCNYILFWIMTTTAVYFVGLADAAVFTSPIDLSPRHAGLLMGLMVSSKTLLSFSNLTISGVMTTDPNDLYHWQLKCLINVISAMVFMTPFLVFGSAKKQNWDCHSHSTVTNPPHTDLQLHDH